MHSPPLPPFHPPPLSHPFLPTLYSPPEDEREASLYYLLARHPGRALVFVNAVSALRRVAAVLKLLGLPAQALHAQQQQRQRLKVCGVGRGLGREDWELGFTWQFCLCLNFVTRHTLCEKCFLFCCCCRRAVDITDYYHLGRRHDPPLNPTLCSPPPPFPGP